MMNKKNFPLASNSEELYFLKENTKLILKMKNQDEIKNTDNVISLFPAEEQIELENKDYKKAA